MRRILMAGLSAAVVSIVMLPGLASASPNSGTERFQITSVNSQPGAVVARGVFNAGGTDYPKKGNSDLFVFSDGAFTVRHPGGNQGTFSLNPKTCVVKFTISGPYSLNGGVGRYEGIKGSGTYSGVFSGVLPRKANGACNEARSAQPTSTVQKISAKGTVSFS
jgi:hypothetical protein